MKIQDFQDKVTCGGFDNIFANIYKPQDIESQKSRYMRNPSVNRCKRLRINAATTASQPPEGLFPTAIPFSGTEYLLSIDLRMCPMQSI